MSNEIKGKILEDLVAMMHAGPGITVETRRKLPVIRGKKTRKREIDVLLSTHVAGYPIRIAFSCKNERKPLDTLAVDNFAAILEDVGIPVQCGILVSAKGYTSDAQDAATARGMRTLIFEGLNADRLGQEINAALQAVIYLLVSEFNLSLLPDVDDTLSGYPRFATAVLDHKDEPPLPHIFNAIWELWVSGKIPDTIGKHLICLMPKRTDATWMAVGAVTVTGWMASVPGTVKLNVLKDASGGTVDRMHIAAAFDQIKGPLTLEPITSEEALTDILKKQYSSLVVRMRVPRIVSNMGYWPPTIEAVNKAKALLDAGKPVTFDEIESTNIMDAWNFKSP